MSITNFGKVTVSLEQYHYVRTEPDGGSYLGIVDSEKPLRGKDAFGAI